MKVRQRAGGDEQFAVVNRIPIFIVNNCKLRAEHLSIDKGSIKTSSRGIEPLSPGPKPDILSIKLRAH